MSQNTKRIEEYKMEENCHVEPITKRPSLDEIQNVEVAFINIWGMGCQNCANRVRNSLITLNGVVDARVDHIVGKAQVAFNPNLAAIEDLIAAVASAGGDGRHEYGAQLAA
jgi:copper chaperone CopZ